MQEKYIKAKECFLKAIEIEEVKLKQDLPKKIDDEVLNKIDWDFISTFKTLSNEFIKQFHDKLNWYEVLRSQKLSEQLIMTLNWKMTFPYVFVYQKVPYEFIENYKHKVDWHYVATYQKLTEEFIENYSHYLMPEEWEDVFINQNLSLKFIEKHQDRFTSYGCMQSLTYLRKYESGSFEIIFK
jgi:hypothetical protein